MHLYFLTDRERPRIVYPQSETVDYHYTIDTLVRSRGEINLCMVQPYTPQQTTSSFVYRQGNRTVRADTLVSPTLASWHHTSVSIGSKVISGTTKTSLLYYIRIDDLSTNEARLNRTLGFLKERVLSGRFSCSVGNKNRISFSVYLNKQPEGTVRTYMYLN